MPVLEATDHKVRITWLGRVPETPEGIRSAAAERLDLTFEGAAGELHSGLNRASCVRVRNLYPKGTTIRNVRQLSVLSHENLTEIADAMGLDVIDPTWLGASVIVQGIPDFTHIPPSSRILFDNGTCLTVDMENRPCGWPQKEIAKEHPEKSDAFLAASAGRRGVTAWIEREGSVGIGDQGRLFIPTQGAWRP